MKRQPTEWENVFANDISEKVLISKIYKELIKLNAKKITNHFWSFLSGMEKNTLSKSMATYDVPEAILILA